MHKYRYQTTEEFDSGFEYVIHASNTVPDATYDQGVINYELVFQEGEFSFFRKIANSYR